MEDPEEPPQRALPSLPLPEPWRGQDAGSFAHHTVTRRLPELVRLVLEENSFPNCSVVALQALIDEMPSAAVRQLEDSGAPDNLEWERYLAPFLGQNWLEIPWFFAEAYFFRRILEATGYFQAGPGMGVDPYLYEKQAGLKISRQAIRSLAETVDEGGDIPDTHRIARLIHADLWGNQADLSMWPVGEKARPSHASPQHALAHLLIDDTGAALTALFPSSTNRSTSSPGSLPGSIPRTRFLRVDFIVDNAGFELVCDLCLADALLQSCDSLEVHLHLRGHPIYISDATLPDIQRTTTFLVQDAHPPVRRLGSRLEEALSQGRLRLKPDFYWCSPLPAWEMPAALYKDLALASLVISKGDANYRRLTGDRRWPFTTPFEQIVSYFPASLLALRTFKSQLATGLQPGQAGAMALKDPGWMTNGRWGIVQFKSRNSRE